jgi:beta-glucosidase
VSLNGVQIFATFSNLKKLTNPFKMKRSIFSLILLAVLCFACETGSQNHQSALLQYDPVIDTILPAMTLEEKVDMLHGKHMFVSAGVERLGIADMRYADGPFGIREELQPDGWAPLGWENDKATFFPTGSALAATWSPELAYEYGTGMAREARLRGKDMILGPAINIQRIPTGGRTYEYLSEDPFLSARLSVGYTRGVQDNGVAVCLKHFALNNQENNRGRVNVVIGERAMREIYLPPFRAAVTEADAYGVMAAYNKVNGWWCSENDMLLNRILRDEWDFKGFVISDWNGTHSTVDAVMNGLNVEMPGKRFLGQALLDTVNAGAVSVEVIDQRVREILRVRLAIEPIPPDKANTEVASQPAQQKIAYEVASKSIVLLKNDGILPLGLEDRPVIAVIGDNATRTMALGGVGAGVKTLYEVTPLEGLENRIGDRAEVKYVRGYAPRPFSWGRRFGRMTKEEMEKEEREYEQLSEKLREEALDLAAAADVVLFIGGNNRMVETESMDRRDILLPYGQDTLVKELAAVNERLIMVLVSGAPNDLRQVQPVSQALLISWFNGTEGGNALADVLLGNISPGGRLPFTIPVKLEDSPAYAMGNYPQAWRRGRDVFVDLVERRDSATNKAEKQPEQDPNTALYSEESLVGYRWFDTKVVPVMYPFGHGLTYTSFAYNTLETSRDVYRVKDVITLSFDLENTGEMAADEVAQVYVHRINPSVEWPYKELKAFARVSLEPGENRKVTLELPATELRYWDESTHMWEDDPCDIELLVGASAGDIRLRKTINLKL